MNYKSEYTPKRQSKQYCIKAFSGIDANNNEEQLNLSYCSYGYNICIRNGAIVNGIGIDTPIIKLENGQTRTLPDFSLFFTGVDYATIYKKYDYQNKDNEDKIIVRCLDGYFYKADLRQGVFSKINDIPYSTLGVSTENFYQSGIDKFIVSSEQNGLYIYNGATATSVPSAPKLGSVCMHYQRLFGYDFTNPTRLWFSGASDPTDWVVSDTHAGYIDFMDEGGNIVKVVSFKDYIYVFKQHCVIRLTAYASPIDFVQTTVFSTDGIINGNTVTLSNKYILFTIGNKIYSFDGYQATEVFGNISSLIDNNTNASGCVFDNKFYLTTKLITKADNAGGDEDVIGTTKNNGIIIVDLTTGEHGVFRGSDIRSFLPIAVGGISALLVYFNNFRMSGFGLVTESGKLFTKCLNKLFVSPMLNLDNLDMLKVFRRFRVNSSSNILLTASTNEESKTVSITGSDIPKSVLIRVKGDKIGYKISTTQNILKITGLTIEASLVGRYYVN